MTKINVRGRDLSLRFILTVGVLLIVGVAAMAYFVRTGRSIRRHDPKAVLPAPLGVRPERLPLKTPMTPEKPYPMDKEGSNGRAFLLDRGPPGEIACALGPYGLGFRWRRDCIKQKGGCA